MEGGGVQEVAEIAGSRLQILVISPKCKSALVPTGNEIASKLEELECVAELEPGASLKQQWKKVLHH